MARSAENFANFALQIAKNEQKMKKWWISSKKKKWKATKKKKKIDSLSAPFLKSVTSKNEYLKRRAPSSHQ